MRNKTSTNVVFCLVFNTAVIILFILDALLISHALEVTDEDFNNYNPLRDVFLIISSAIVMTSYIMFLLMLRIFENMATMVNVIIYVIKGSSMFLFVFFLMTFAFGNTFYILSMLDDINTYDEKLSGSDMWTAFLFVYRTNLADLQVEDYDEIVRYKTVFMMFFLV